MYSVSKRYFWLLVDSGYTLYTNPEYGGTFLTILMSLHEMLKKELREVRYKKHFIDLYCIVVYFSYA